MKNLKKMYIFVIIEPHKYYCIALYTIDKKSKTQLILLQHLRFTF